jgi:hypothetical protein
LVILTLIAAYDIFNSILDYKQQKRHAVANATFGRGGSHGIAGVDKAAQEAPRLYRRLGRADHHEHG